MITAWYFSLGHPNRDVNIGWLKDETDRKQPQTVPCEMLPKNSQIDAFNSFFFAPQRTTHQISVIWESSIAW